MKSIINGVLIVEGIQDESYLNSFLEAEIITTNGYDIPKEEIDYLLNLKEKEIIIFVDPDEAGISIRNRLNKLLTNAHNVSIDIKDCVKGKKFGVAEANKEAILKVLKPYISNIITEYGNITMSDLYNLKIVGHPNSNEIKNKIIKYFHLGNCNSKKLLKRINYKKISLGELKGVIDGNK